MRIKKTAKVMLTGSALILAVILAAYLGALDFLADDGSINNEAIDSLLTWWVAFCLAVIIVVSFKTKPLEMTLTVASLILAAILAESAVRIVSFDRAKTPFIGLQSKTLHHIYPPNADMFMGRFEGTSVTATTNEDGLRTEYTREEFLKHKHRVMLLGDSFALGFGVNQDKMCSLVAENILRKQLGQKDIAVISAGVISYSPLLQERLYRHRLAAYKPTVVMLLLDGSDIGDDVKYEREATWDGDEVIFEQREDQKKSKFYCALYEIARPTIKLIRKNLFYPYYSLIHSHTFNYDYYKFDLMIGGKKETNHFFIYRHPLKETRLYFERTLSRINSIAKQVMDSGAYFVLVVTPRHQNWSDRECPNNWEMSQYLYKPDDEYEYEYFRFFREVEDSLDYDVYDMLPAFQRTEEFPLVFNTDPYWNERGHAFVGNLLANYLINYNIIR